MNCIIIYNYNYDYNFYKKSIPRSFMQSGILNYRHRFFTPYCYYVTLVSIHLISQIIVEYMWL